jgi:hypothetical protein
MARDGIADITYVNPGYQAGRFPIISHGEIPFYSPTPGAAKALDQWYRAYADQETGDVKFCMALVNSPGTFHSEDKLILPADVRGKNIRPAQGTIGRFINMLGGASVWVPARRRARSWPEVPRMRSRSPGTRSTSSAQDYGRRIGDGTWYGASAERLARPLIVPVARSRLPSGSSMPLRAMTGSDVALEARGGCKWAS